MLCAIVYIYTFFLMFLMFFEKVPFFEKECSKCFFIRVLKILFQHFHMIFG